MWKLFSKLFGNSQGGELPPPHASVDPREVCYSLPTIAADNLRFVEPTPESFEGAPQFHEDEWSQLEFYPAHRLTEVQQSLSQYKAFEAKHRAAQGWTDIYVRSTHRDVVIPSASAVETTAGLTHADVCSAPILFTASNPLGQVENGFGLQLSGGLLLYGISNSHGITTLAARVETESAHYELTQAFTTLYRQFQLALVDWQSQQLLVSASPDGNINVWSP